MEECNNDLQNFWENSFQEKQLMWGETPTHSASIAAIHFEQANLKNILIPGIGYGRNAKPFLEKGMTVSGIEISKTAIELNKQINGSNIKTIFHGSTKQMPYNNEIYDGIFCYSLIHLLDEFDRSELISSCYNQLKVGGQMIFVMVSKNFPSFGKGKKLSEDRFETIPGVRLYFYDPQTIDEQFKDYGLIEVREIQETNSKYPTNHLPEYWFIRCIK